MPEINGFAVIYRFEIKKGKEDDFIIAWKEMTSLIISNAHSLGSRLHKINDQVYMAYAQWLSREQWETVGDELPEIAIQVREKMRALCTKIEIVHELEIVEDMIRFNFDRN